VGGIRVAGRSTQGVIVFDTHETEKVVSVERVSEGDDEDDVAETGDVTS
jgi:DNA gyrase subunit A